MSRVITFSMKFPKYHPKAGQPTYFVEKVWKGFSELQDIYPNAYLDNISHITGNIVDQIPKFHTIRGGERFKVGDKFSPRVWSGKPYASKQIIIAPDLEVKKVWNIEIKTVYDFIFIMKSDGRELSKDEVIRVAINDGLSLADFENWFIKPFPIKEAGYFHGQIISWNENIEY